MNGVSPGPGWRLAPPFRIHEECCAINASLEPPSCNTSD
jgi:hypothetical protein